MSLQIDTSSAAAAHYSRQPEHLIALSPLRWNLVKTSDAWSEQFDVLSADAAADSSILHTKHSAEQQALHVKLQKLKQSTLASFAPNPRLQQLRGTVHALQNKGKERSMPRRQWR